MLLLKSVGPSVRGRRSESRIGAATGADLAKESAASNTRRGAPAADGEGDRVREHGARRLAHRVRVAEARVLRRELRPRRRIEVPAENTRGLARISEPFA